jgi:Na+/H+-dicarboxylate symporter
VVIPLAGATFKLSPVVNYSVKLLFLAYFLGIPLRPGQIVVFAVTVLLLSPATQGIPSFIPASKSLPAFVAAGIPAEYVLLLGATRAISDVFLTVLNSTGYLTATVLISRLSSRFAGTARPPRPSVETAVTPPGLNQSGIGRGQ